MRSICLPAVLVVLAACSASRSSTGSSVESADPVEARSEDARKIDAMLPRPKRGFTLHATPERAPSLRDVVVQLEAATGVHFLVGDQAREQLSRTTSGLLSDIEVPPAAAWRVVETMLAQNGFVVVPSRGTEPVTVTLASTLGNGSPKSLAIEIDASAIDACAEHPAVIFSTVLEVAALDARQLSTSLRQLYPDQRTQSILPLTGSQLLLVGMGADLVSAVRMIQTANTQRAREIEARRGQEPASAASAPPH